MASKFGRNRKSDYICNGGMFKDTATNRTHIRNEILTTLLF